MVCLFAWLAQGQRGFSLDGFGFALPGARLAAAQTAVSVVDLIVAEATLYLLMPGDLTQNFAFFFVIFIGAIALGILNHAPGGLGVFEATIIADLGADGRSDVLAALILYRLVDTVLPFMVAVGQSPSASR